MAKEAKVKTEGVKFLKRNRALEEDEAFMARAAAGALRPSTGYAIEKLTAELFSQYDS